MHSTTFSSFALAFYSAGPSDTTPSRRSSFTCGGDEVIFNNTGPVPGPIERPKMAPKVKVDKVGLGLGLPTGDLHISFRDDSKSAAVTIEQPTKAELRSLRVGALRRLGIFLDDNTRPNASSPDLTDTTTTTTESSNTSSSNPNPHHDSDYARIHNRPLPIPPSQPLLPYHRPSFTRLMAHHIAKVEDEEQLCPTYFTHSPLPVHFPTVPPSTPAFSSPSSEASPFPIDDRDDVVEVLGSPYPEIDFHPFSPRDEREEERYLPMALLVSPEVRL
ncbi:hypothetical protein NLI96_g10940 [Meripilus lineatus]|uniref:Uncharacterized protein n=1 Tax=Meripilus lineatus TaxID=2056292 RepID=A0AAD5Y9L9_9APHY|nr:hypothetical protein NLI96_g10940 [Physisporinus lineatus]